MIHRVLFAGLFTVLFFVGPAAAAENDIRVLGQCYESGEDPTVVKKTTIPPHKPCDSKTYGRLDAIVDQWLGYTWWVEPTLAEKAEPEHVIDVIDDSKYKACQIIPPDASFIIEWFQPRYDAKGQETKCEERGKWYRLIRGGEVCLMPGKGRCIKLDNLHPLAKVRVRNSILAAKEKLLEDTHKHHASAPAQ